MLLAIIAAADGLTVEQAYTRFAGLDMIPRLNMAINLARECKWPKRLITPLVNIRTDIQNGLGEQRNLFVHGVHKRTDVEGEYALTMSRWKGDKRHQTVTVTDAVALANRLSQLAQKANAVHVGYGNWKFGLNHEEYSDEHVAQGKTLALLIRAHNIKRALKLLFANLRPW